MKTIVFFLFCLLVSETKAQTVISGNIIDKKGNPVMGANIFIEGSYDGVISDQGGDFKLSPELTGRQFLIISFIGFEKFRKEIVLDSIDIELNVVLKEEVSELNEVVITAGVFNASDKKKSATLNAFDIATTPSAMGDIYGAFATMPGSQKVGEEGMLFVRGGESYETKTYMDGMLVSSPYFSKLPDIPTRGRFSPLLFSETSFSTGGYSAEYGQALSSVVDLSTNGLETADKASVAIMTVGSTASLSKKYENASLAVTGMYVNSFLQNRLFRPDVDWIKDPAMSDATMMYRKITGKTGMLKVFCSYNNNYMSMNYDNFEQGRIDPIKMKNNTFYSNISHTAQLNEKWIIRSGFADNREFENMQFNSDVFRTAKSASHMKLVLTNLTHDALKIRIGSEVLFENYLQKITVDTSILLQVKDVQPSVFVESDIKISRDIALRIGGRAEYSSVLGKSDLSPRISAACKTGTFSQLSLAWGLFSQKPGNDYLKITKGLNEENSAHYILNYQYKNDRRILRMEAYAKSYDNLIKYKDQYSPNPADYSNNGNGFAKGIDIFWRDQKTLKGTDYWISYSFLDTERNYRDYPESAPPSYASRHNFSAVYKYLYIPLKTYFAVNYTFASGRPYNDKNADRFMSGRTKQYHDVSLNITHITSVLGKDAIIHMSITNLTGYKNVYGYRYSQGINEDGIHASQAVVPATGTQAILMLLVSL